MRTVLAGELTQAQSYLSSYYIKLEVQNGSGTWIDVGAALGRKWIVNASWGETVDAKVMQVTFTLWQEMGGNSLSPLMTASVLNRDDLGAYAPLLNVGRLIRSFVATMPHLVPLDVAKYREFVTGRIDNVQQADSLEGVGPIAIVCSDLGGWLMDMQIETSGIQYGTTPVGTALETVLQNVLTANIPTGEPAVTLYKQSSSSFAVTDWKQGDTKVLEALSTLVLDSTGEDIRYRYDAAHASRLTWFNPDRTRVTVDATFAPGYTLRSLDLSLANIRNVGEMPYQGGVATAMNAASAAPTMFRRRFFRLPASPMITVLADAQKVIDAVVNDLSAPPGEAAADIPFFWPVQLYDRYTFQANARQYDADQTFAVLGYQHTIENGRGSTTLTLTARIVGAFSAWLTRLQVGPDDDVSSLRNVTWTETATQEIVSFGRGPAVLEVWAAYAIVAAPVLATDFDTRVAPFVGPLPDGATTFTVPRPADGFVVLVQLEPRLTDLSAGKVRRLTITAAPQVPLWSPDDRELATTATQWIKFTERGIAITRVESAVQLGTTAATAFTTPTRGPGAASAVHSGVLGPLEYEQDLPRDASRTNWTAFRYTLANGDQITTTWFGFDRDTNPNLGQVSVDATGRYVTVSGDNDTKAIGLYLKSPGTWKYEVDGTFAIIDVQATGTNGVAGLAAATSGTFTAKALGDPVASLTAATLSDNRDVIAPNGGSAAAATWSLVSAGAPPTSSFIMPITLKATSAPGGWTAKLWIADPSTVTPTDVSATVSPALSAIPIVNTAYQYTAENARVVAGPGTRTVTVSVRAELLDGSGVVQDTVTRPVTYYTTSAL